MTRKLVLSPPVPTGAFRWEAETTGLATALLELGAEDLPDVLVEVEGSQRSPGFARPVAIGAEDWSGYLSILVADEGLRLQLDLCEPTGLCEPLSAVGSTAAVWVPTADLLAQVATRLEVPVDEALVAHWAEAPSRDSYACLLLGRAAAVWYGMLPPVPEAKRGSSPGDTLERAARVDPTMHAAWWLLGRDALAHDEQARACAAFQRARDLWPGRLVYQADHAACLGASGRPVLALSAWEELGSSAEADPRVVLSWARAAWRAGSPQRAVHLLLGMNEALWDDPAVAELRVDLASRDGLGEDDLALLQEWTRLERSDPEPIRRRVQALLALRRYGEAYALLPELEARGRPVEAATLAVPLALERGDWGRAEAEARRLGWEAQATRIALRGALELDPTALPPALEQATDLEAVVARGAARLERGEVAEAVEDARLALEQAPWSPVALALGARAFQAGGDEAAAHDALARLREVDPLGQYRMLAAMVDLGR